MLRVGDVIGMGTKEEPISLYVEVTGVRPDGFSGDVINGAWRFFYEYASRELTAFTPRGDLKRLGYLVTFTDAVPKDIRRQGYNEVMQYMREQLLEHSVTRTVRRYRSRIATWGVWQYPTRFKRACRAFAVGWREQTYSLRDVDFDDDEGDEIPF